MLGTFVTYVGLTEGIGPYEKNETSAVIGGRMISAPYGVHRTTE